MFFFMNGWWGRLQEDGSYDYPYIYEYLESDVNNLDFAMFNMEGTLAGPPYTGYPMFRPLL